MTKKNQPTSGALKRSKRAKKPTKNRSSRNKVGRWEKWEHEAFLQGLKIHGKGNWKLISKMIPTRTTVQVKTHAQMYMKALESMHGKKVSLSESCSCSHVDEMTASTVGSLQSHRSIMHVPVVITVEASTIPVNGTPRLKTVLPTYDTPRLKTAAYILATLNQTFIQRNQCF